MEPDEFEAYIRTGAPPAESASDGYLLPDVTEADIGKRLSALSPIRSIAAVRQVSGAVLKKPFAISGPVVGWVGETEARPETAFAEQEGAAFVNGDGVNKPRGFLDYPVAAEASWSWGNLGYVSGPLSSDVLIDTIYALKSGYRQNASWVMNRKTQASIRKLKDADGNYLWQPPAAVGQPAMLMGFRVVEAEDMPDAASDETPIAFGDFSRGYLVVDRTGVRVLRDPYSQKPYVLFYTTKRVGGGVQDFDAIKLLKIVPETAHD